MEEGRWEPDFFLREVILGRLGIEGELYEYLLDDVEARQFYSREEIMESILWNRMDKAEALLDKYRRDFVGDAFLKTGKDSMSPKAVEKKLAMQFYLAMLGQARQGTASRKELYDIFNEALLLTVPGAWKKPLDELVLSVGELNLMLEAERNREGGARPEYLLELMRYMEERSFDGRGRVKVYPKAVYLYLQCGEYERTAGQGAVKGITPERLHEDERLLEYCEQALEMLRDNGRMYFLWEILDIRGRFLERKLKRLSRQDNWMIADAEARLEENRRWKGVLERIYETWGVSRETGDFCYIYTPKAVANVNEVIRIRRRMLGLTQQELCDGVCSRDTIVRLEQHKVSGQREILRGLLRRLGLSGEFVRSELETESAHMQELMEKLHDSMHMGCWDEVEIMLWQIEGAVNMGIPCNRQFIESVRAIVRWRRKEISRAEYCRLQREALELTVPFEAFLQEGEKHFTHQEQTCILDGMQRMEGKNEEFMDCMRAFEELYRPCLDRGVTAVADGMYELVMGTVGSEYGNMGEYDKADMYNRPLIHGYLRLRKLRGFPFALYAHWWNYAERRKKGIRDDRCLNDEEELTKCLVLCNLAKERKNELFCQKKLLCLREGKGD